MISVAATFLLHACLLLHTITVAAQDDASIQGKKVQDLDWKKVATQMPDAWYGSDDAKAVANNVLFCQQDIGGWAKNKPFHHALTRKDSIEILRLRPGIGATFDNNATIMEMMFLAKVYAKMKDERYLNSFEKGLNYILKAQYKNGGWPQYYPFRKGKTVDYASHITYNDNAMVNIMTLLRDIYDGKPLYIPMQLSTEKKQEAKKAFEKGVECILQTQIKVKSERTVWCAQHDEITLAPANARAYELASFSGSESVGITMLLMEIRQPSPDIIEAVKGAVKWFDRNKIQGIRLETVTAENGRKNLIVVKDKQAPDIWARFYDLSASKPFFCDRDGVKKSSLAEIGEERRNGYSWYTTGPSKVLRMYPVWLKNLPSAAVNISKQ